MFEYGVTPYLSVFSPNAGKYGPEKTPYLVTFHAVTKIRLTGFIQCVIVIHIYSFYKNQLNKNNEVEMCRK